MQHQFTFEISRRSFIRRCSATAMATGLPLWFVERELALAAEPVKALSPNDRPRIALIGCGGIRTKKSSSASTRRKPTPTCHAKCASPTIIVSLLERSNIIVHVLVMHFPWC